MTENQPFDVFSIDLASDAEKAKPMKLLDPRSAKPLGPTFMVIGAECRAYRRNKRMILAEVLKEFGDRQPEDEEADEVDMAVKAAAATVDWSDLMADGVAVAYSQEDAYRIMLARPYIARQVVLFSSSVGNFSKP